jgi:hypothetical protein
MYETLPTGIAVVCLIATVLVLGGTVGLVVWIPMWNQAHNYIDHVSHAAATYEAPPPLSERITSNAAYKAPPELINQGLHHRGASGVA